MSEQPHWRRWAVLGVVVGVVAIGVVLAVVLGDSDVPQARPSASPSVSAPSTAAQVKPALRSQRVLLFVVRDDSRRVAFAQIMATGRGKTTGKLMTLSTDLLVPTPTWSALRATGDANDTLQSQHALEELLGINIDISLILDRLAFAGLIDATLTPSEALKARASDGVASVVGAAIEHLPSGPEAAGQLLLSLGHMARSSASNTELVDLLLALRKDGIEGKQKRVVLPISAVRGLGAVVADRAATDALMRAQFPVSLLNPGEAVRPRVMLVPAGATAAQLALATQNLIDAGMTVIPGETGARVVNSRVLVPVSQVGVKLGQRAAAAIGLLTEVKEVKGTPADVEIVLGADVASL